jgi:hypothetical protein
MMRLVFILYAEVRGLMPASDVYQRHYSVSGLFERLREDQAQYPDTMDARYGAWAQMRVLFRLIHDGGGQGDLRFPPRHGRLFDPDVYPFLEGHPHRSTRQVGEVVDPPKIADVLTAQTGAARLKQNIGVGIFTVDANDHRPSVPPAQALRCGRWAVHLRQVRPA